ILLVKSTIWAVSLGSGTSGGVLAPLLMMGGALGGLLSSFLPNEGLGFWPLIAMGAILGGAMRSPFTGVVFAVELTHDVNVILPLLLASVVAHAFTVLTLKRSILTEKVARRGYHLSREYAVDPLEILFVREVMRTNIAAISADIPLAELAQSLHDGQSPGGSGYIPWSITIASWWAWFRGASCSNYCSRSRTIAGWRTWFDMIQRSPIPTNRCGWWSIVWRKRV